MPINVHNPQADVFKRKLALVVGVSNPDAIGNAQKKAIERRKRQAPSNEFPRNGDPVWLKEACRVPADLDAFASLPSFQPGPVDVTKPGSPVL